VLNQLNLPHITRRQKINDRNKNNW